MGVIFPLMLGYIMEIYRGRTPPPNPENFWRLFIDGLKLILVCLIYAIPICVIILVSFFPVIIRIITKILEGGEFTLNPAELAPFIIPIIGGMLLAFIVGIIITLISSIGIIRMVRLDSLREAFNFSGIHETIRGIGWGSYILAMIILCAVLMIIGVIVSLIDYIPVIGFIITFFLGVPVTIFEARYMTLVYESSDS